MRRTNAYDLDRWGLHRADNGALTMHGLDLNDIADRYGTPVHVVSVDRLRRQVRQFMDLARTYAGKEARVHYACKCNGVPGILREILAEGMGIEVMSSFELMTALAVGYPPGKIIVNGPCKSTAFLREIVQTGVHFIVVDSLAEIEKLDTIAAELDTRPSVVLRVNPDIPLRGVNRGSSTGSRKHCAFGLDLRGGEVELALDRLRSGRLAFEGFHAHIGTGIRDPLRHGLLLRVLARLIDSARKRGLTVSILDVGGGFPSPTSREFSTGEMLAYQAFGWLPVAGDAPPPLEKYFQAISQAIQTSCSGIDMPGIIFEPGRSIVSNAQFLLLSVEYLKRRVGTETWVITDGGIGTVALPAYYEYHEIIPCRTTGSAREASVTILGPGCFAADILVRNKRMPLPSPGDVLAVMDSGAYFTAMESNFGYPRPAIVAIDGTEERLMRRRETFGDFVVRDDLHDHTYRSQE